MLIDIRKWIIINTTDNFIIVEARSKFWMFYKPNNKDLLELCEIFKTKGYKPHFNPCALKGIILFKKVK